MRAFFSPLLGSFSRSCVSTCTGKKKNKGRRKADVGWLPGTSEFSCSHSFMQTLTNQKSRTVSSWLLIGLNLYERMWKNQKRYHFLAPCCKAYLPNGQGSITYPLTDEQKLTLGKQNMRAACPGQAGIQYSSSSGVIWKISTEQTYHRFFFSNSISSANRFWLRKWTLLRILRIILSLPFLPRFLFLLLAGLLLHGHYNPDLF